MALVKNKYPILEYDTVQEAVIRPDRGELPPFPKKAVFAFLLDEIEHYALTHMGKLIDRFETITKMYPIYECEYKGEKVCLCQAPLGAAAAVQLLEYLIDGGVTQIISAGSCGALVEIHENEFMVPILALRDEGISYHYLPPSREIAVSKKGILAVETALSEAGFAFSEVKIWTTDGFYRETEEMVRYRIEEGCQVVEMECSGLAACAEFRGVTWGMLLFTADTLADTAVYQERNWGKESMSVALRLALDAVILIEDDL